MDEAACLGAGEAGSVGAAAGILLGPGWLLLEDGSVHAGDPLLRSPEAEPNPAPPADSPPAGLPRLTGAPLLPITASLTGEGEGVDGLPPRILLLPIAEEPLGAGDSGSEGSFLAHSGGSGPCVQAARPEVLAQPSEAQREASGTQTVPLVWPPCLAPDPLEKVEAKDPEAATQGILLAHAEKTAEQAPGPLAAPQTGTPADAPFAVESRLDAQRVMGAASAPAPNGGADVSLQPGGRRERMTRPPPVAGKWKRHSCTEALCGVLCVGWERKGGTCWVLQGVL